MMTNPFTVPRRRARISGSGRLDGIGRLCCLSRPCRRPVPGLACGLFLAQLLAGCESHEGPRIIHELEIKPRMASSGMPRDAVHGFGSMGGGGMAMPPGAGPSPEVEFDAPEGWRFEPGTGMRAATFKIADEGGEKEATIIVLPDANEGYAANIRRWLGQLGVELPEPKLAAFIEGREEFSTAAGEAGAFFDFTRLKELPDNGKGSMLATIIEAGGNSIFVKLTGGAPFLEKNREKFLALSKSVRMGAGDDAGDGEDPAGPGGSGMPATATAGGSPMGGGMAGSPGANMGAGMGGGPMTGGGMSMQSSDPAFNQVPAGVSRLTWQTPAGWKSLAASGMRTGSFAVAYEGKTADGSIVQLPGPAGGWESNVRRWMEQAGIAQFDDAGMKKFLQEQKRIRTRDGNDGIVINLASLLGGNMVQDNSIVAAIINAPDETIFVKLTGPRAVLLKNVDALAQLASSLKTGG